MTERVSDARPEWNTTDVFRSNDGAGPLRARILLWARGKVEMERWHQKSPSRRVRYTLSERYFTSPSCGWKLVAR